MSVIVDSTNLHPKKVCWEDSKAGKGYSFFGIKNISEHWTRLKWLRVIKAARELFWCWMILVTLDSLLTQMNHQASSNLNVTQQQQNSICRDCPLEYRSLKIDSPNRLVQSGVPLFREKKIKPVNVIISIFWRSTVFKEVVCKQRNGGRILIAFNTNNRLTVTKPAPS